MPFAGELRMLSFIAITMRYLSFNFIPLIYFRSCYFRTLFLHTAVTIQTMQCYLFRNSYTNLSPNYWTPTCARNCRPILFSQVVHRCFQDLRNAYPSNWAKSFLVLTNIKSRPVKIQSKRDTVHGLEEAYYQVWGVFSR